MQDSGGGKPAKFRVALIWARLQDKDGLGASQISYAGSAVTAVTSVTVTGDGIGGTLQPQTHPSWRGESGCAWEHFPPAIGAGCSAPSGRWMKLRRYLKHRPPYVVRLVAGRRIQIASHVQQHGTYGAACRVAIEAMEYLLGPSPL